MKKLLLLIIVVLISITACKEDDPYVQAMELERKENNEYMKNDPNSPFNKKGKVEFHSLNYYPVDKDFIFESKLYENEVKDTVTIYGTKGEPRETVRWGYVLINYEGEEHKVHVYESTYDEKQYYSIWFTDKTTGETTYEVGRYLSFDKVEDTGHVYTIDFNKAFNPYCAYTPTYSCAIPTKEDYIDIAIEAGEQKFHN